jgi:hypothetical protein
MFPKETEARKWSFRTAVVSEGNRGEEAELPRSILRAGRGTETVLTIKMGEGERDSG